METDQTTPQSEDSSSLSSQLNQVPEQSPVTSEPESKQNNKLVILLSSLFLIALVSAGIFAYQNYELKQQIQQLQKVVSDVSRDSFITTTPSPKPATNQTTDWQTYENKEYGYEFKYPKDWRIASSIMEWHKEEATNPRYAPLIEDWVMVTNLSVEEEAIYLSALESYQGIGSGISHIENADGRAIEIQPTTNMIKELKENEVPGWDFSNFREIKIKSGLTITQFRERVTWEMDRDFEVAYVPYPGDKRLRDDKITCLSLQIERNDGNYENEVFNQILFTFRFVD